MKLICKQIISTRFVILSFFAGQCDVDVIYCLPIQEKFGREDDETTEALLRAPLSASPSSSGASSSLLEDGSLLNPEVIFMFIFPKKLSNLMRRYL